MYPPSGVELRADDLEGMAAIRAPAPGGALLRKRDRFPQGLARQGEGRKGTPLRVPLTSPPR